VPHALKGNRKRRSSENVISTDKSDLLWMYCREIAPFETPTFSKNVGELIARATSVPQNAQPDVPKRATHRFKRGHRGLKEARIPKPVLAGFSLLWLDLNFPVAGFETRLVSAGRRFDHVINKDEVFGTHRRASTASIRRLRCCVEPAGTRRSERNWWRHRPKSFHSITMSSTRY
jgi:hypothetical protein